MNKPHLIRVSSQKGGVGKTTVAVNFASALSGMGRKVLLIDADFINPSVGFHMGMENPHVGVRAVLTGKVSLEHAAMLHPSTGVRVLAGEIHARTHTPTKEQYERLFGEIERSGYDFVVVDTPPGFFPSEDLKPFSEAIIVTLPEPSSCTAAARIANHYDKIRLKHMLIINRRRNRRYELHTRAIEEMMDGRTATAILSEDEVVPESVAARTPAIVYNPNAAFSRSIKRLAAQYLGMKGQNPRAKNGLLSFILGLLGMRR
ncbi:MAG: MinD/ParA family protein [Candidatus Micrarchaeota archaeon]|nr:MinD/ParA family protein [Candidatus Micrarchaeota archaeon]